MAGSTHHEANLNPVPPVNVEIQSPHFDLQPDMDDEAPAEKTCHEIDITNYIPPEADDNMERILNMSVAIDPSDPFDEDVITKFLSRLSEPLELAVNYNKVDAPLPALGKGRDRIQIG